MSKNKSRMILKMHNYHQYDFRYCDKCQEPIATTWANWKYKYCLSCSLTNIDNFRKENKILDYKGGIRKEAVRMDYASGRRWIRDRCEICGFIETLDVHSIIPRKEGGEYTIDNVVTLCPNCHALITRNKKELKEEFVSENRIFKLIDKV